MDQTPLSHWVRQLCGSATLDLSRVGEQRADIQATIDDLGLKYKIDGQIIRLRKRIEMLDVDSLQLKLAERGQDTQCQYRLTTESTNLDVIAIRDRQADEKAVTIIATCEKQTKGKGRRGNHWISPFGENIYCTVGVLKTIKPANLGLLSIVTGLAICEALASVGYQEVKLKWPNDLYHQGKKLGGILIESRPVADDQYFLAIGFGINVDMSNEALAGIEQAVTCLNLIASNAMTRNQILFETVSQILKDIEVFSDAVIPQLVKAFDEIDAFKGMPVNVLSSGQAIAGTNAGIAQTGQLQLETEQGMVLFWAADISLRRA
ncbi:MAG: BirA family biotin operon repressor/biotin-[acetyl-CoA-carboxylase] ligase [Urechidicola sp.]|jgi:BirA family biotin operon repressor/biotin-[acetyl-CoA-carboxylase] ligase